MPIKVVAKTPQRAVFETSEVEKVEKAEKAEKTENAEPIATPAAAPRPNDRAPSSANSNVPPPQGGPLIVGGAVIAGVIGAPLAIFGASGLIGLNASEVSADSLELEDTPTEREYRAMRRLIWGGCVIPGVLALAGGAAMVVIGTRRSARHRAWKNQQSMANRASFQPLVGTTRLQTGVFGLQGRF